MDWAKCQNRHSSKSDQAGGILPKWFSNRGIILAKGQLDHSFPHYTHFYLVCKYTPFQKKRDNLLVWLFYSHFWGIFCQPYGYLSQIFGADGHFRLLNMSKSQLDPKLKAKMQIIIFLFFFSILEEKIMKIYNS